MGELSKPTRHKLAVACSVVLVGALTVLGIIANNLAERQDTIEKTVNNVRRVQKTQLLCNHPETPTCKRRAYNVIVSCLAVPRCKKLLFLGVTTPPDRPIVVPSADVAFESEGGAVLPSPGHQQPGGSHPPHHGHAHHPPSSPPPAPAPPTPEAPAPPPPPVPSNLKVCAKLPGVNKCVEAAANGEIAVGGE